MLPCGCIGPSEAVAGSERTATSFQESIQQIWRTPIAHTPFYKDLPRLCKRLVIRNSSQRQERSWEESTDPPLIVLADLMNYVMHELEPERAEGAGHAVYALAEENRDCKEPQELLPALVALAGEESLTIRALKMVNQSVILAAVQHLHDTICKDVLTKDVRTRDGWRVHLTIGEARVELFHIRRQQSLDVVAEHYEYDFEVALVFDRATVSLSSASLRMNRLDLAPGMSEELKGNLRNRLLGDVIVS